MNLAVNAFEELGAARFQAILDDSALARVAALFGSEERPGRRLFGSEAEPVRDLINAESALGSLASRLLGSPAFAVRILLFDKTADKNWALGAHQDRTIAVAERHDVAGFGPWTVKAGQLHVQPSQDVIEAMITLRAHVDRVDESNAPLCVITESHRLGRLTDGSIEALALAARPMICLAEPGDVWAYRTAIVHSSRASNGIGRRRVLQIDYASGDLPDPLRWAFRA